MKKKVKENKIFIQNTFVFVFRTKKKELFAIKIGTIILNKNKHFDQLIKKMYVSCQEK